MRCLPIFSESSFSLSFFLTTPAKKPRTECGCQPVASMMAAIVVPLACRNMASTVSCFEGDPLPDCADTACAAAFGLVVVLVGRRALGARLIPRDGFAVRFANFDFCLLVAIRPSSYQRQHHVLPLPRAPRMGEARGRWGPPRDGALNATTHAPFGAEVERNVEQSYDFLRQQQPTARFLRPSGADAAPSQFPGEVSRDFPWSSRARGRALHR